ncbi:DbpA RNA binding domain protein [Treponema primitia ZAS-2]|uniref:DbpA RNA binding domain protein n=1 Tax=Treponema primitia (strain ATCC BAA-887 / DSM 12427 / ZAS-2) TaxID=545694 RepID=F5YIB9_TREPZ|nr:DbpA RNA binding domain-containing protein [Treponema primitia]AEF84603.1 DbpA RNA binding domain protein [Treponema primitia ZAS-2]
MSVLFNEEKIKNRLDEILEKIQTEADPKLLNQYRSLFRKKVSFFRRSYLAAYLLMIQDQGTGRSRKSGAFETAKGSREKPAGNARGTALQVAPAAPKSKRNPAEGAEAARQPLPEEESTRIFISIGRNRRVFPREILGLIGTKTQISKDDIGLINILNNYSFIQVRTSVAEELITALNGVNFRGRTLTVNHARARKDENSRDADETFPEDTGLESSFDHEGGEIPAETSDFSAEASAEFPDEEPETEVQDDETREE